MTVEKDLTKMDVVTIEHQEPWLELSQFMQIPKRSFISLDALMVDRW